MSRFFARALAGLLLGLAACKEDALPPPPPVPVTLAAVEREVGGDDLFSRVPYERLTVRDALYRETGIDLDTCPDAESIKKAAEPLGIKFGKRDTFDDVFFRIFLEKVEPKLGMGRITILDRYPASEAALARRTPDDARVSERFEIYACGVELANGFGELTNTAEQRRRFTIEMEEKARLYGERYPLDEDFLAALAIMPEASGIALGFDRLVMLATGASRIDQVVWVPVAE